MKVRLLNNKNVLWLLFETGEIFPASKSDLNNMLFNFRNPVNIFERLENKSQGKTWNHEYPDIQSVPGDTLAYITDEHHLVVLNFAPFAPLFDDVNYTIEDLYTIAEYAEAHNKSVEQVKVFCRAGRIPRAKKIGRDWVIPKSVPYPYDRRVGAIN